MAEYPARKQKNQVSVVSMQPSSFQEERVTNSVKCCRSRQMRTDRLIQEVTGDLDESRFWWSGVGGGGQTPTRGSLREKRKPGIIDGEYSYLLFFNQLTVKGSREVVARGKNGVMRGFLFVCFLVRGQQFFFFFGIYTDKNDLVEGNF